MSFYKEYWEEFLEALRSKGSFPLSSKKTASDKNWLHWECFGRKGFKLIVSLHQNSDWICVNFGIDRVDQKFHFAALKEQKELMENESGISLRWDPLTGEKSKTQAIITKYGMDVQNRAQWAEQHAWMLNCLEKMYFAFKPQIEVLE